jgi:predicted acetyltransferase
VRVRAGRAPEFTRRGRPARDNRRSMLSLVTPDVCFEASYRDAVAELATRGDDAELGSPPDLASFAGFVEELRAQSEGRGLPPGWVAGSTFWLVDDARFIGKVEVRHSLTPALRLRGGHIGYAIRPSERRQGYGTAALRMVLPTCQNLGLVRVLLTCDATNEASRRIIETNGGELENAVQIAGRAVPTLRYWIEVEQQLAR